MNRLWMSCAAALLAGCGVGYNSQEPARATEAVASSGELTDPFFFYDRPAEYEVFTTSVEVPVRGDTFIYCDLLRPALNGEPAPGKFPGIISEFNAYAATNAPPQFFAQRGYNVMACDAPGSGNSPGIVHQFDMASTLANYDVIEWFGTQEWSNGRIGQQGSSYGGHTSNLVARLQPPHLKAIVPNSALHDWYENTIYHGGIRNMAIFYQPAFVGATGGPGGLAGNTEETAAEYGQHPLYDDFWRERSVMPYWDSYTVPALVTDGWHDRYKDGTTKNFMARKENVWMLMGPWVHSSYAGGELGTLTPQAHQLAWYDHWLYQLPTAPLPRAKVTTFEMPNNDATAGWHQFDDWPPPGTKVTRLHFQPDRSLAAAAPADASTLSWTVNGDDTGADPASSAPGPEENQPAAENSAYRLHFTTAPLETDVVIAGATEVMVRTSFTASDGNVIARIFDVGPDGSLAQVATGWIKASHYAGHDHLETITPGQFYAIPVHVWPNHYRFLAGHAIRISFSSGDMPDAINDAPQGTVTVELGPGSYVELPVLSGFGA
jgi:predicted acyl esterase